MPAKAVKLWLQNCNFESQLFSSQLELSSNGHSLKYPLDTSVADNSKLIFIAPPTFEDGTHDPFSSSAERIVRVSGITETLDLAKLMGDISPEVVHQKSNEHKNKLRTQRGFKAKKERLTIATVDNKSEEILTNPDRMSIHITDDTNPPYIRCNVNGGDSNAYYFKLEDPRTCSTSKANLSGQSSKQTPTSTSRCLMCTKKKWKKKAELTSRSNARLLYRHLLQRCIRSQP